MGVSCWRFAQQQQPWSSVVRVPSTTKKLRVALAGSHFPACYPYTQRVLQQRNLDSQIELLPANTWQDLMDMAPHIHAAIPFMERFTADFIKAAPNLQLIQQQGVGLEGVDIATATNEGIAVCNIPSKGTANAEATAEHGLLLTMMLLRNTHNDLPQRFTNQTMGAYPLPRTLLGQRITVVGYGAVGSQLCQYLIALGASKVTAVRKRPWSTTNTTITDNNNNSSTGGGGGGATSSEIIVPTNHTTIFHQSNNLDDELPTTDVLILCCAMTPETHHIVNEDRLRCMPTGSYVINIGRGPLVEYHAILNALNHHHIAGYASDVGVGHDIKPSEPWDPLDPLSIHPNTIFTPHVGGNCDIVVQNMAETIVTNLERIRQGEEPYHWVNKI